jgi:hypothetical protein
MHLQPHVPAVHVLANPAGVQAGHALPQRPQLLVSPEVLAQYVPQLVFPESQLQPHAKPSQVACAPAGAVQAGPQDVAPQVAVSELLAQPVPHAWKVALQVKPQAPALQTARPFPGE